MSQHVFPHMGEVFALLAPLSWSFAVILFRRTGEVVPPIALNLFKNILAIGLFFATLLVIGPAVLRPVPFRAYVLLFISGAIGIGISDMLFFMTLNRLGAGLQAIVNTFYSPSIIFLSVIFLGETLTPLQIIGVGMILGAVLAVTWMRGPRGAAAPKVIVIGVIFGILAALTQAISIVMIKPMLDGTPLIWANFWRLLGGVITSFAVLPLLPNRRKALATLRDRSIWPAMIPAAVLGSYVSLLFWLAGMKFTQASTASALNQTSTLFTFSLAALLLHEPVTPRRLLGLAFAAGGVFLVTFGA